MNLLRAIASIWRRIRDAWKSGRRYLGKGRG